MKNHKIEGVPARYWDNLIALLNIHHVTFGDAPKNVINKLIAVCLILLFVYMRRQGGQ